MQCSSCNKELPDRALFCPWCGFQLLKTKSGGTPEQETAPQENKNIFEIHRSDLGTEPVFSERSSRLAANDLTLFSRIFDLRLDALAEAVAARFTSPEILKNLLGPRGLRMLRLLKSFYKRGRLTPEMLDAHLREAADDAAGAPDFDTALQSFQKLIEDATGLPEAVLMVQEISFLKDLSEEDTAGIRAASERLRALQDRISALMIPKDPLPPQPAETAKAGSPFNSSHLAENRERLKFSSDTGNAAEEKLKERRRAEELRNFRGLNGLYSDIKSAPLRKPAPKQVDSPEPDLSGAVTDPRSYQGLRGVYRGISEAMPPVSRRDNSAEAAKTVPAAEAPDNPVPRQPEPDVSANDKAPDSPQKHLPEEQFKKLARNFHGMNLALSLDLLFRFVPGLNMLSFLIHAGILWHSQTLSRRLADFFAAEYRLETQHLCHEVSDDLPVLWGMFILNIFFGGAIVWLAMAPEWAGLLPDEQEASPVFWAQIAGLLLIWGLCNIPDYLALRNYLAVKRAFFGILEGEAVRLPGSMPGKREK
ncbi:zinc ribbon domain-containing protein [Succinimonas sp.]|uniref:zinc ribbon domain-containing protein n=1 Tax=Succinimonas sp. TaxID=1936151 RepID=UPI0038675C61